MPIVLAINPPKLSANMLQYLKQTNGYNPKDFIAFGVPMTSLHGAGAGWPGGSFNMGFCNPETKLLTNICWSTFTNFTNNCGMRAIQGINGQPYAADGEPLYSYFVEALERYATWLGYSALVGSDGLFSGAYSQKFITKYGRDWKVESLGQNRRMGLYGTDLYLFWKYLPVIDTTSHGEWNKPIA